MPHWNSLSLAIITIIIFVHSFFCIGQILLHSNPLSQLCVSLRSHPQFSFFCVIFCHFIIPFAGARSMPFLSFFFIRRCVYVLLVLGWMILLRPIWLGMQFMLANCQWWTPIKNYFAIEQIVNVANTHSAHHFTDRFLWREKQRPQHNNHITQMGKP